MSFHSNRTKNRRVTQNRKRGKVDITFYRPLKIVNKVLIISLKIHACGVRQFPSRQKL
jgi:hypothetical protein